MINKKELRLGNSVEYNGQVYEIQDLTSENPFLGIITCDYLEYEELFPIQLTEEWLLKFGFKENEFSLVFEKSNIHIYEQDNIFWIDILDDSMEIKSVHQLQNLYFALTGEELTIKD